MNKKHAIAVIALGIIATFSAIELQEFYAANGMLPDGCQPCDCSGAVVALPADVTALAADASVVTEVAK